MIGILELDQYTPIRLGILLQKQGQEVLLSKKLEQLDECNIVLLFGASGFETCMARLTELGAKEYFLNRLQEENFKLIGINSGMLCLGKQHYSTGTEGLGLLDSVVRDIGENGWNVNDEHYGWHLIKQVQENDFFSYPPKREFYFFNHTEYLQGSIESNDSLAVCKYGGNFAIAVQNENISGLLFHPERSSQYGVNLFKSFIKSCM
ncbi:MAG: hypothetical protein MK193_06610 [Lentisphaeria bacterium]|nr:hypothetical protein [Lentisphaeria bacterium]